MTEQSGTKKVAKVYIGKKRVMDYVFAGFVSCERADKIEIHARGRMISKAVDVAEVLRRKLIKSTYKVEIGSFEAKNRFERTVLVSTIIITITL